MGPVEDATRRDLERLPSHIRESARAALAVALARKIDGPASPTGASMAGRLLDDIMVKLLEQAPAQEETVLDDIRAQRAKRRDAQG